MAPLIKEFKKYTEHFQTKICVTAQHREMLDQVLDFFEIQTDYDLDLMKPGQNLHTLTAEIIVQLKPILEDFEPDIVLVHGDTTTSMAGGLAAFYSGAKVGHIEAGLRTGNKKAPFPEEINRQITGRIADFHFAPTPFSKQNLLKENISEKDICVTGNTVIDALLESIEKVEKNPGEEIIRLKNKFGSKEIILVTGHRRENHGAGFEQIGKALREIAELNPEIQIVYPVHLNPKVQEPINRILGKVENIHLIEPLAYQNFIWLMNRAKIIITDSGGIQEEAPSLGKPVLVMRSVTERPEAVLAGTVILVGTNSDKIVGETMKLLENPDKFHEMSKKHNPYGDGKAAQRIVQFIKERD